MTPGDRPCGGDARTWNLERRLALTPAARELLNVVNSDTIIGCSSTSVTNAACERPGSTCGAG